jgi:hypothetical protein
MKRMAFTMLFLAAILMGCRQDGCRDRNAVNFNPNADDYEGNKNDSCCYSLVGFYLLQRELSEEAITNLQADSSTVIDSVEVFVDDKFVGWVKSTVYDEASIHCSSPDVLNYRLSNGEKHDWYAKAYASSSANQVINFNLTGQIQSKYEQNCQTIKIH